MSDSDEPTDATKREGPSGSDRAPRAQKPAQAAFERGTLVGRYVILDKLGEGGMGIVYSAFDPELDRKVAIKVLQGESADGSSGRDQAWLLREAQALARLQHPNVVAVHDVGTLPGDQVFVAMELVDGVSMRQWLKEKERPWREIVPLVIAAGEGLAAAHRAGLVHRDFKPENVLVGKDGRVRVLDFGLARLRVDGDAAPASRDSDLQLESKSPLSAELTLAGHVVGTPAYMAPEIFEDAAASARTDQFAFGVTLFEALYHARPYDKKDLQPNRSAPPKPKIPDDVRVPVHLQRVVLRAIAIDPKQRFATLDELVSDLARDPLARRRRVAIGAGAVVALAAVVVTTMSLASSRSRPCQGLDARLAGVWDVSVKKTVREAFVATKLAYAPQAYADLEKALDAYTHEWTTTAVDSCEGTRVRGDQTEEIQTLRELCLEERLDGIQALVHVLQEPTQPLVEKGGKAVQGLDPIAACSNITALRVQGAPRPELLPKLHEIQHKLAEANAQQIAGNFIGAGAAAMAAGRLADEIGWMPAKAQADIIRALPLLALQKWDEAAALLTDGFAAGVEGKRDDTAAYAAYTMASLEAQGRGHFDAAKMWVQMAHATHRRYGTDANLEVVGDQTTGVVAGLTGDIPGALAAHAKALAGAERIFGANAPMMWELEEAYAASLGSAREDEQAARHFEHAIELRTAVVGGEHQDIGLLLSNLGANYTHLHDPRAKPTLDRALAIREKKFGKGSPILVPTLENLAEYLRWQGELEGALAFDERGRKLSATLPGKEHPLYQDVSADTGMTLMALGRYADARAVLDETLELEVKAKSTRLLSLTEAARGELALAEKDWPTAADYARKSIDEFEAGGHDNPSLWWPLGVLGRAEVELGKLDDARGHLKRAVELGDKYHIADPELVPARAALGKLGR
jgi:tetratricopeptide (TPR) repeat protein